MTRATTETAARRPSLRFSARDLVNVAIFAVIFIVVSYAIGMLGVFSPLTWILIIPVSVIVNGIPFMLFLTRVQHAGMVFLFAAIVSLFYLLSGNTLWSTLGILVLGVLAELVVLLGRYRSKWAAIWAYVLVGFAYFTPFLPLVIDRRGYFESASWAAMGSEYIADADALLSLPVLGALAVAILVAAFLGGLLGTAVLRKHFVRAGLA